jgi:hypothetical protein
MTRSEQWTKIDHINNKGDNMSNPRMGQESSPRQDDDTVAAQDSDANSPYPTTRQETEHRKRDDTNMEKMFAALADNTKLQMKQQENRHAKEIADMRQKPAMHTICSPQKQLNHKI